MSELNNSSQTPSAFNDRRAENQNANSFAPKNNADENISKQDYDYALETIKKLSDYYDAKVVGQQQLKFSLIGAIIADGHILIESVPGLAKTTAAKAISDAVDGKFARIQCTPDLCREILSEHRFTIRLMANLRLYWVRFLQILCFLTK